MSSQKFSVVITAQMNTERISKFQPDRTLYLRGFTGFGAAASLCQASPTGFTVNGVFRDQADFCVLVVYDADNIYEHYSVKYLPNFDLSGIVLNFNLSYQKLQPIDSAKYSWIDWASLDVVKATGEPVKVTLWDYATLVSSNYTVASGTYTLSAPGGCTVYDRLTLFVNDASFDFLAAGGETAAYVAATFANSINAYNWSNYANSSIAVLASADSNGNLTLKNARTGLVSVAGTSVSWTQGTRFPGIAVGSLLYLAGHPYTVASVNSPTSLTLTAAPTAGTNVVYLAEYGGVDGNDVQVYMVVRLGNQTLAVNNPVLQLAGGNSDDVIWNINLDFSALGLDQIRQAWLTFAPQLAPGAAYSDSEWTAAFTDWTITDPNNVAALPCAGPQSVRVGNGDPSCLYQGSGWQTISANNYWHGFGQQTANVGDSVMVTYTSTAVHDLYLGTSLFGNRGEVSVSLDGDSATKLECFLNVSSEVVTRRVLRSAVPAGTHTISLVLSGSKQLLDLPEWDVNSTGTVFLFDYIEAAVASDIPEPLIVYNNVSAALDFDTDATYKVSPQRLLWHMQKLGFAGQLNEYVGVYWWNQRKRIGANVSSVVVTFSGNFSAGDSAIVTIGTFPILKSVTQWDTPDTIASHFVYYINASSVSMWAQKTGAGQLTIYTRTPLYKDTFSASVTSTDGSVYYPVTSVVVTFGDIFSPGDSATITIGAHTFSYPVAQADTFDTIASQFVSVINAAKASLSALKTGDGQLTISSASPLANGTYSAAVTSAAGTVSCTGNLALGFDGTWQIDTSASNPINFPVTQWHADLFQAVQAAGLLITAAFSMELVNPPDDDTVANTWIARFGDNTAVETATDFSGLYSSQCAPVTNLTNFQKSVYTQIAGLQNAAGLTPWLQFGEFVWWYFSSFQNVPVGYAAYTTPISIGVAKNHGFTTGDRVVISGVQGMSGANGTWTITVTDTTHFTLDGSVPNGPWTVGTGTVSGGSMGYYDPVTQAAAQGALGRPLYKFTCQDDDPTVNGGADAAFLAAQLKAHVDAIREAVLAQFPNAKFELLYPNDVNCPTCYVNAQNSYPQGGRMNATVNLPAAWRTPEGSGLDRMKVEALSWGSTYRNLDLAMQAITFPLTGNLSWPLAATAYLIPWFNGACPWTTEFQAASRAGLGLINFWAYDHIALMSWPIPFPSPTKRSFFGG